MEKGYGTDKKTWTRVTEQLLEWRTSYESGQQTGGCFLKRKKHSINVPFLSVTV
jgi:hypothetical protein